MKLDERAFPLTRRQLDIWLSQETGHSGTEWQLGLLARIEGAIKPDLLEEAIRIAIQEAEPCRAAFFDMDGHVFQRAIENPDRRVGLDYRLERVSTVMTRGYGEFGERQSVR